MDHYSLEEWLEYVKNELGEKERVIYEDHLYTCDQCLEVYLEAMDKAEHSFPSMPREDGNDKEAPLLNASAKQKPGSTKKTCLSDVIQLLLPACLLLAAF